MKFLLDGNTLNLPFVSQQPWNGFCCDTVMLNYYGKVAWHIPADIIHSSATSHTVNSWFEQMTTTPCSLELPLVGVEGHQNVDSLQLTFDCLWIFCATHRSSYDSVSSPNTFCNILKVSIMVFPNLKQNLVHMHTHTHTHTIQLTLRLRN
jgi:hypothetical protein